MDSHEVWSRIASGGSLAGMGLATIDDRFDLRKTKLRSVTSTRSRFGDHDADVLSGLTELRNVRLENIDFAGSMLPSMRLHGCEVVNCVFDDSKCRDWRFWNCRFVDVSFRRCD